MLETVTTGSVTLRCPSCGRTTEAVEKATTGWPYFAMLVHACECGYTITESEWDAAPTTGGEGGGR